MIRRLIAVFAGLSVAILGCGKPEVTTPNPASAPPTSQTVQSKKGGAAYTLQIPPGWKWNAAGMANKSSGSFCSFQVMVEIRKPFSKDDTEEYAKKSLDVLRRQLKGQKGRVRDLRIIKVGDVSAVWSAVSFDPGDKTPTSILKTQCFLRTSGRDVQLECSRTDVRPDRKESDFVESQEEFLKIVESFRVTSVEDAQEKK
jgi:hypothetical protein